MYSIIMTTHLYLASPLHLVNFEELPRQHKELLFFRYGLPCKDNLEVCNTHQEKGIEVKAYKVDDQLRLLHKKMKARCGIRHK